MKIHFESYQPLTGPFSLLSTKILSIQLSWFQLNSFLFFSKYGHITYLSISVSRDESLNPFANGLLSILSLVICKTKGKRSEVLMQFLHFWFHLELIYQVLHFNAICFSSSEVKRGKSYGLCSFARGWRTLVESEWTLSDNFFLKKCEF